MLTPEKFVLTANQDFADNTYQQIRPSTFRKFAANIRDTFVAQAAVNVPDYEPGRYYAAGFVIRHSFDNTAPVFLEAAAEGYLPAPTAAAGDDNWLAALSPASGPALSQVGTVEAMRTARGKWVPGWLFVLIGRVDPVTGDARPDVYVKALSAVALEPNGFTIDNSSLAAVPVPVSYDLASDETAPVAGGNGAGYSDDEINALLNNKLAVPISYTLSDAKNDLAAGFDLALGVRYDLRGKWNGATTNSTVFVQALRANAFSPTGILLDASGNYSVVTVDVPAGTTTPVASAAVQQQHTQLLNTLAAKAANLYAHYADNSVAPFSDLDSFLASAGLHGGTLRLEGEATALAITKTNRGNWPAFWDAAGSTIFVPAGEALKSSASGLLNLNFGNFFLDGSGSFLLSGQLPQDTPAAQASRLFAGWSNIPLDNAADVVLLDGGYYKKIRGAGKYYLLGSVRVDDQTEASNVVDLRQATGGGGGGSYTLPPATATALGGVRVGRGLQVDGAGVVSVGDTYTQLAFQPTITLDMGQAAQLLTLTNNVALGGTSGRAQGRQVRVFLFNNSATAITLAFPSAWAFLGVKPSTLAAGKKAVLTLECVYGSAEGDIVAGYVDQN